MKIKVICTNCNGEFETDYKFRDKKFCNRTCYFEHVNKFKLLGRKKHDDIREERKCIQCGVNFIERKKHKKKLCSDNCRKKWNNKEENKINRIKKSKESFLEKHGVDSLFKKDEFKKNFKNRFKQKHGVENPMYKKEFVDKLKNKIKVNYLPILDEKLQKSGLTLIDEYVTNKNGSTSKEYSFKCVKCSNIFTSTILGSGKTPICRNCHPITKNSEIEKILRDFLNKNNIKHVDSNRKILNGKEIDLFLPDKKIGIECNGNYYHSEIYGKKNKNYHISKTNISNEKGVKLIHIFEDEIHNKKEIVLSRVSNLLNIIKNKIFARKCEVKIVKKTESDFFLKENHIQGKCVDKIRIGLYYNNELVSLITFGNQRLVLGAKKNNIKTFELLRFCSKLNTNVVGGFSKLLNFFIKNYNPEKIITYSDIRWSGINYKDTMYYKNGFEYVGVTKPNYWYVSVRDFLNRQHRFNFRKNILVEQGFDNSKTEWEIMQENGYDRIWDCGSMKFELNL
jgi:hypothetical protein